MANDWISSSRITGVGIGYVVKFEDHFGQKSRWRLTKRGAQNLVAQWHDEAWAYSQGEE